MNPHTTMPERVSFVGSVLEAAARQRCATEVRADERAADVLAGLMASGLVLERRGRVKLSRRGRIALQNLRERASIREDLGAPLGAQDHEHLAARAAQPSLLIALLGVLALVVLAGCGLGAWRLVAWAMESTR